MIWFILGVMIAYILGYEAGKSTTQDICPREVAGWNCKYDECDHSAKALYEAIKHRSL